jgi:hypothetical protein
MTQLEEPSCRGVVVTAGLSDVRRLMLLRVVPLVLGGGELVGGCGASLTTKPDPHTPYVV